MADVLRQWPLPLAEKISVAFIYGSIAKDSDTAKSDIDVMLIGENIAYPDMYSALVPAEERLGRKISPAIYNMAYFTRKLKEENSFLIRIMAQQKIFLIGSKLDLPETK